MTPLVVVVLMIAAVLLWTGLRPQGGRGARRCSRCWRAVDHLQPYVDGRREFWICGMCAAEMDFVNAERVDIPRG